MAPTLKSRVLDMITAAYPASFTNLELASNLGAPEASVRRASLALYRENEIENVWVGNSHVSQWKRRAVRMAPTTTMPGISILSSGYGEGLVEDTHQG